MIVTTERANPSQGHHTANVDADVHIDVALRYLVEAVAGVDQFVELERALPVVVELAGMSLVGLAMPKIAPWMCS
jgi:hypothetical protein